MSSKKEIDSKNRSIIDFDGQTTTELLKQISDIRTIIHSCCSSSDNGVLAPIDIENVAFSVRLKAGCFNKDEYSPEVTLSLPVSVKLVLKALTEEFDEIKSQLSAAGSDFKFTIEIDHES